MILPSSKQQLRSTHGKRQANNLRQNNPHIVSLLLFYYFVEYTSPNLSIAYSPFLMNFPSCSKADVQKQEESNAYQYDHIFPQGPAPFHGHELQIGLHSHEGVVIAAWGIRRICSSVSSWDNYMDVSCHPTTTLTHMCCHAISVGGIQLSHLCLQIFYIEVDNT